MTGLAGAHQQLGAKPHFSNLAENALLVITAE